MSAVLLEKKKRVPFLETEENLRNDRNACISIRAGRRGRGGTGATLRVAVERETTSGKRALFGDASDYLRKEIVPRLVEHDSARFYRRRDSPARRGKRKRKREIEREREKNALVITRLRDDQKEACGIYSEAGTIAGYPIDRSALCRREPQPSVEQFSFFKQRQYVGSWVTALARNSYTHGRGGEGRNGGKVEWVRGGERRTRGEGGG